MFVFNWYDIIHTVQGLSCHSAVLKSQSIWSKGAQALALERLLSRLYVSHRAACVSQARQRDPRGSLLHDLRGTGVRIFDVSASCYSICVTEALHWNSYRNADRRRSVCSRNKALLPYADLAGGKSDQRHVRSPRACSRFWPAILKPDRMTAQSQSWSEDGKGGSLGGLVVEVLYTCNGRMLLGFNPVIIRRTRYGEAAVSSGPASGCIASSDHLTEQTFP